jgi:hypothetical protein
MQRRIQKAMPAARDAVETLPGYRRVRWAWPVFATEAEDYRDFYADRTDEHAPGTGGKRRKAWIRHRLAEIALLEHHQRVSAGRDIDCGRPKMLHIG